MCPGPTPPEPQTRSGFDLRSGDRETDIGLLQELAQILACPTCLSPLVLGNRSATCMSCKRSYLRGNGRALDFRPANKRFKDWMSVADESMETWLRDYALGEAEGASHVVHRFLAPLLSRLELGKGSSLLSVGCGGGWDVSAMRELGLKAFGVDNGGRSHAWTHTERVKYLFMADAIRLPFKSEGFDFVFSEGVIEHIGYPDVGPSPELNWALQRIDFASSLLRVTKVGGYLLIASPNRLFPVDFFHGRRTFNRIPYRFHSPREHFLVSFRDIQGLFSAETQHCVALSPAHFLNLSRYFRSAPGRHLIESLRNASSNLAAGFWSSMFSPYLVVLIQKVDAQRRIGNATESFAESQSENGEDRDHLRKE